MSSKKFIVAGLAGGVASFFSGWIIYGMLLMDLMMKYAGPGGQIPGVYKPDADMIWWAIILSSMCSGFMLSYIFNKVAIISSAGSGAAIGFVIGLFMYATYDFNSYSMTNLLTLTGIFIDIIAAAVMTAIAGAVVGWVNGMGKTKA